MLPAANGSFAWRHGGLAMRNGLAWAVGVVVLVPAAGPAQDKVRVERGVLFARVAGEELKLDIAVPVGKEGPFPAVVCIHGGGWVGGDRAQMARTIEVLAERGFVALSPDYRLAPKHRFPAPIEDCKCAVRWLRANAKSYGVDPDRIGALGFSAGAHLACLLGVTEKDDGLEGEGGYAEQPSTVQAVVSFFGPTDLVGGTWSKTVEEQNLIPLLGGRKTEKEELYRKASPVTYAAVKDRRYPPFLFFHGDKDEIVSPEQSRLLCGKLQAAGGAAAVEIVEGEGHGWRGEVLVNSITKMTRFLQERLRP
jgi:acetyl esterase/lipase